MKYNLKIIGIFILAGIIIWIIDSTIDFYFYQDNFIDALYRKVSVHDLFMRTANFLLLSGIGILVSFLIYQKNKIQTKKIQAEKLYKKLSDSAGEIILVHDLDGNLIYINPFGIEKLNINNENIYNKKIFDFFNFIEEEDIDNRRIRRLKGDDSEYTYKITIKTVAEKKLYIEIKSSVIYENDERKILLIGRDITERQQQINKINHLNSLLRANKIINNQINNIQNPSELITKATKTLTETRGYISSWIILLDEKLKITDYAHSNLEEHFQDFIKFIEKSGLPKHIHNAINSKKIQFVQKNEENCKECPLFQYEIIGRTLMLSLQYNKKLFGVMSVTIPSNIKVDESEYDLFYEINTDISIALYNISIQREIKSTEEKYKIQFEKSMDAIIVADIETGIIEDCNNEACQLFGRSKNELIGMHQKYLHPEYLRTDEFSKTFKEHSSYKEGKILDTQIVRSDKTFRDVAIKANIIEFGGKKYLQGIFRDITDRIKTKNELKSIFENSMDMICTASMIENKFLKVNPAFTRTLGYSEEELLSRLFTDFIHKDDLEKTYKIIEDELQKGKNILEFENRYICKDGTIKWLRWASNPILEEQILYGIAHDITDRKEYEEKLIKAKAKAEESDKLKSAFLANMSHEIRTPINGIMGFAQIMKNDELKIEEYKEFSEIVYSSSNHLLNLITDIIDISKIESGQMVLYHTEFDLNYLMKELYSLFTSLKSKKNKNDIRINLHLGIKDEFKIKTDDTKLRQVLNNILSNALKFTHIGSIDFGYELIEDKKIKFFVKDTGIGIPDNQKEIIFERFRQVEKIDKYLYGGTGLGLSISKACVDMMNGEIWVNSNLGKGSEFFFTISYEPVENENVKKLLIQKTMDFSGIKILVAEDDFNSFLFIKEALRKTGAELIHSKNGKEAIESIKKETDINLILMDLQMPIMNGYIATSKIKKIKENIPIIAQTAFAMAGDKEKAINAGCDDYITKPIDKNNLFAILNKYFKNINSDLN